MLPLTTFLFPSSSDLLLEEIIGEGQTLLLSVRSARQTATCPDCATVAEKVHSRYVRTLADVSLMDYAVRLRVQVRRFFCSNPACGRQTFAEPFPDLAHAHARRTHRHITRLCAIAKALGGRPGARESANAHLPTSRHTLLRLLRCTPLPAPPPPRVIGVDDWALRKGETYGTILVDLQRHRVVDLLPDRRAETFAAWLEEHPGIDVISRDRASAYAEGGRLGAPRALQVADRWHLLHNVAQALEPVLRRQERLLKQPKLTKKEQDQKPELAARELRLTPAQRQRRAYLHDHYGQVQSLYEQGKSLREIAQVLEIDTNTLRYFVQRQPWATDRGRGGRKAGEASLDEYRPYIHQRWKAGCRNGMQLWREIRAKGYRGSASSVRPYLALLRQAPQELLPAVSSKRKPSAKKPAENVFSVRRLTWLVLRRPELLTPEQAQEVERVSTLHPDVALAFQLTRAFAKMLRERAAQALPGWLASARASSIPEFVQAVQGMERDVGAVAAALSRPESNGQTEGKVNKLKCLKRQMYGRAKFDLLRQRMLLWG